MGKSAPDTPDPKKTSAAQTSTNIGSSIANNIMGMVSETSPTGSLSYKQSGTQSWTDPYTKRTYDIPTYNKVTSLNPTAKKTFNYNQSAEQNLAKTARDQSGFLSSYLKDSLNANRLPSSGKIGASGKIASSYGANDFSADRDKVESALMERMKGQLDQDQQALETSLVNRGVNVGSEAYSDAQGDMSQRVNDARLAAILGAGQEQSRLVGMDRDRAAFQNAAQGQRFGQNLQKANYSDAQRGQALEEMFAFRNQPINEIAALLAGSQVQMPQFANYQPAKMPTTDVSSNIWNSYNADMSKYNQKQNFWGNLIGAGGKMATGFI